MEGFTRVAAGLKGAELPEAELSRAKNLLWGDYHRERQRLGPAAARPPANWCPATASTTTGR